ncbi:MAG: hypothetical protein AB1442_17565 [Nitrospirota bacterium]
MVIITDRDIDIFKILSSGASDLTDIRRMLRDVYKTEVTPNALQKRLFLLKRDDYIQSKTYARKNDGIRVKNEGYENREGAKSMKTNVPFALYALTVLSIAVLVDKGYDHNWIRASLPGPPFIRHDEMVREVVRAIKREAGRVGYSFGLVDELNLKKMASKYKTKENLPDLLVRLTLDIGSEQIIKRYNLEIDNNTISPSHMVDKVLTSKRKTLIICNDSKSRMESFLRAFKSATRDEGRKNLIKVKKKKGSGQTEEAIPLAHKVVFTYLKEFCARGFLQTNFISIDGEPVYIVPPEINKKIVIRRTEVHGK